MLRVKVSVGWFVYILMKVNRIHRYKSDHMLHFLHLLSPSVEVMQQQRLFQSIHGNSVIGKAIISVGSWPRFLKMKAVLMKEKQKAWELTHAFKLPAALCSSASKLPDRMCRVASLQTDTSLEPLISLAGKLGWGVAADCSKTNWRCPEVNSHLSCRLCFVLYEMFQSSRGARNHGLPPGTVSAGKGWEGGLK